MQDTPLGSTTAATDGSYVLSADEAELFAKLLCQLKFLCAHRPVSAPILHDTQEQLTSMFRRITGKEPTE